MAAMLTHSGNNDAQFPVGDSSLKIVTFNISTIARNPDMSHAASLYLLD